MYVGVLLEASGTSSGRESQDVPAVGRMLRIGRDLRNMLGRHRILQVAPRLGVLMRRLLLPR